MVHVQYTRLFEKDAATVWAVVSKFTDAHHVHPDIDAVTLLTTIPRGKGARRRVLYFDGSSSVQRVTEWKENDRSYTVVLEQGSLPVRKGHRLRSATTKFRVEELEEGGSRLCIDMELRAKVPILGKFAEYLVLKPQCKILLDLKAEGIEHFADFNRKINPDFPVDEVPDFDYEDDES